MGEAPGTKLGGVVQQVARELNVEALPADVPEYVEVDLSGLDVGDILRLQDVPPVAGVTFLDDPAETVIATCSTPRGLADLEAEEEAAEGEEGAAGEVSGEAADADDAAPADEE